MKIEKRGFIYLLYNAPENLSETEEEEFIREMFSKINGKDVMETVIDEDIYIDDYRIDRSTFEKLAPFLKKTTPVRKECRNHYKYSWMDIDDAVGQIIFERDGIKLDYFNIDSVMPRTIPIENAKPEILEKMKAVFGEKYRFYNRFPVRCDYILPDDAPALTGQHKEVIRMIMDTLRQKITDAGLQAEVWATSAECETKTVQVDNCVELTTEQY